MKKICLITTVIFVFLLASYVFAAGDFTAREAVFAEWTTNGWFHGKIAKKCEAGWFIFFDDGDKKCCTVSQIVRDVVPNAKNVKVGSKVLAQWKDNRFYPGTVSAIKKDGYAISFKDGDKRTVKLSQIRLR